MWYQAIHNNSADIFETLQNELSRLVNDQQPASAAHNFLPKLSLKQQKDFYEIETALPGIKPESIDLEVTGKEVTLTVKQEVNEENKNRRGCDFSKTISLPYQIDAENVKANYEHGLLNIELPKVAAEKPKTIKVNI